ncbi:Golgi-associated plant pathogenesis-related protein 1-like [Dunckerocampus dactyliophorus]|uniref:Golgi-associated plant pathogenesis-related protein 1-like n=1 Tax=Dunckerocampus dactyliophorus TaxID=161453 RepID=UPI00240505B3|nr:Golgi-associated plant pathogenesis-related protein 1-like [Dunckerocampus dactyliophorus]
MADASFQQEFLETHNAYRARHSSPPMTLSGELNTAAQKWADHLLALGAMQHSNTKDGENLYTMWSSVAIKHTGKEAVDHWYGEIKEYNWNKPGFDYSTGHFTQVVWKGSTQLGVGMATDGNKVIVVGQYRPSGNISVPQYYVENVLPQTERGASGATNTPSNETGGNPRQTCPLQ